MPATVTSPIIDPHRYRAARELCRKRSPDLFFASHFTTKPRRYALYALDAMAHQLDEIMGPPQVGSNPPAIVSAQAASCCSSGSCEGESIAQRQQVCLAVIDHLLGGLETGKPELDAFLDVQPALGLPRVWFEQWIAGMASERSLPRYATWKRLSETIGACGGVPSLLAARVLASQGEFSAVAESQFLAWGSAIRLCTALANIGEDWKHGRVLLPLDDLIKHHLTEKDIATFTQQGATHSDPRWLALMQFELDRIRNLFRGGAKALSTLRDEGARRTFTATGVFAMRRLEKLVKLGGDSFAAKVKMSTFERVTSMPRVVRIVWEAK